MEKFVFSAAQICEDNPRATGRRVSKENLLNLLGEEAFKEMMQEIYDYNGAIFAEWGGKIPGLRHDKVEELAEPKEVRREIF